MAQRTYDTKTEVALPKTGGPLNVALATLWQAKENLQENKIIYAYQRIEQAIAILYAAKQEKP